MAVATIAADTATASSGPVFEAATVNAPTGGTVRAGGAMTGGPGAAAVPGFGDGSGTPVWAVGVP